MIAYPYEPTDVVKCGCCGAYVENTPAHNVALHQPEGSPYPNDDGFGMCKDCGGDPAVSLDDLSEEKVRKRLGWGACCFYDARIELVLENLNERNRAKFAALDYAGKVAIVSRMLEEGIIKW
jgi:hypothetical protein